MIFTLDTLSRHSVHVQVPFVCSAVFSVSMTTGTRITLFASKIYKFNKIIPQKITKIPKNKRSEIP